MSDKRKDLTLKKPARKRYRGQVLNVEGNTDDKRRKNTYRRRDLRLKGS